MHARSRIPWLLKQIDAGVDRIARPPNRKLVRALRPRMVHFVARLVVHQFNAASLSTWHRHVFGGAKKLIDIGLPVGDPESLTELIQTWDGHFNSSSAVPLYSDAYWIDRLYQCLAGGPYPGIQHPLMDDPVSFVAIVQSAITASVNIEDGYVVSPPYAGANEAMQTLWSEVDDHFGYATLARMLESSGVAPRGQPFSEIVRERYVTPQPSGPAGLDVYQQWWHEYGRRVAALAADLIDRRSEHLIPDVLAPFNRDLQERLPKRSRLKTVQMRFRYNIDVIQERVLQ